MNYFEVITADRTWICPKSGMYKIIAVGGGSACSMISLYDKKIVTNRQSGENTTFGTLLTANGGAGIAVAADPEIKSTITGYRGGAGGYTLGQYGGVGAHFYKIGSVMCCNAPTFNGGSTGKTGFGYGAGGGACTDSCEMRYSYGSSNISAYHYFADSDAGEINELICDIEIGASVVCHIGSGGCWTEDKLEAVYTDILDTLKATGKSDAAISTRPVILPYLTPGRSGCIVIQYLGESL